MNTERRVAGTGNPNPYKIYPEAGTEPVLTLRQQELIAAIECCCNEIIRAAATITDQSREAAILTQVVPRDKNTTKKCHHVAIRIIGAGSELVKQFVALQRNVDEFARCSGAASRPTFSITVVTGTSSELQQTRELFKAQKEAWLALQNNALLRLTEGLIPAHVSVSSALMPDPANAMQVINSAIVLAAQSRLVAEQIKNAFIPSFAAREQVPVVVPVNRHGQTLLDAQRITPVFTGELNSRANAPRGDVRLPASFRPT
jgi:hypothetical protein